MGYQQVKLRFVFGSFDLATNFSTVKLVITHTRGTHVAGKKNLGFVWAFKNAQIKMVSFWKHLLFALFNVQP